MKRLIRKEQGKKLTGLCAGIADYAVLDVSVVRLIVLTVVIMSGPIGLLLYVIGSAITPKEGEIT